MVYFFDLTFICLVMKFIVNDHNVKQVIIIVIII